MIPMTRKEWMMENRSAWVADCYTGGVCGCPNTYSSLVEIDPTIKVERCCGENSEECEACWNKEIPNTEKEKNMENERLYNEHLEKAGGCGTVNDGRPHILDSGNRREFESGAVRDMAEGKGDMVSIPWEALLRLSVHYENGAKKYNRWNFRKGIPVSSFIDSACRHLAKYQCGCDDEDHLAAAAFNVLGAMLMENTKPEMQDLPLREGKNTFDYFKKTV